MCWKRAKRMCALRLVSPGGFDGACLAVITAASVQLVLSQQRPFRPCCTTCSRRYTHGTDNQTRRVFTYAYWLSRQIRDSVSVQGTASQYEQLPACSMELDVLVRCAIPIDIVPASCLRNRNDINLPNASITFGSSASESHDTTRALSRSVQGIASPKLTA